jgi:hypothetical protein
MADTPAKTTFIVATDRDALVLEKLAGIEQALEGLVPLLVKIVTQIEAQTAIKQAPIATYEHLYDLPEAGPPEGELVAEVLQPRPGGWWGRLFPARRAP